MEICLNIALPMNRYIGGGGGGGSPSPVTPALTVEYIDTSGNLQTVNVASNGSTTITGVSPFLVHFDGSGSRSTSLDADDAPGAWDNLGYRLNFGESIGGTWTYGGASKDEEFGPPIWGRVYTQVGTHTARLKVRDSNGQENTISLTVVVTAPPTAINIPVSQGSWPVWASNTHYTLDAGGDYTSFGTINLAGLHNVLISKTGAGANPIVGTFSPTNTGFGSFGSPVTQARHCRLLNINTSSFHVGLAAFQYCGVIGHTGSMRMGYSQGPFTYDNNATTPTQRDNLRFARGVFLKDINELLPDTDNGQYIMIYVFRRLHLINVVSHKNGTTGNHSFRNTLDCSSFRHCNFYATVATVTHFKCQAQGATSGGTPDPWDNSHDRIGLSDGSRRYGYPNSKFVVASCQFGRTGETLAEYAWTVCPQNNDVGQPVEGHEYTSLENCVGFGSDVNLLNPDAVDLGGRYLSVRNFRMSLGTGDYSWLGNGSKNSNRIPAGWNGPVLHEEANTRPVPSSF